MNKQGMQDRLRNFFTAPTYEGDPDKSQDASTTHRVGIALLLLALFSIPFILLLGSPVRYYALGATFISFFIWLFTISLVNKGKFAAAKLIMLAISTSILFGVVYALGGLNLSTVFNTLLLLALANLLFPRRGALVYGTVLISLTGTLYLLGAANLVPEPRLSETPLTILFTYLFSIVSVAGILTIASANTWRNLEAVRRNEIELSQRNQELDQLRKTLEDQVSGRTESLEKRAIRLQAVATIARRIATFQDLEKLLSGITHLVSEQFGFYHTGIFLLDEEREYAVLRATNSDGGQRMLARQYRLKLDNNSTVGYAISRGESRIALDVGIDAVNFENPDLPETRSQMTLPLSAGDRVIGALDVQSTQSDAFTEDDITTLATLADQIAIAIENARLFYQARQALEESEKTVARYTRQGWTNLSEQVKRSGYIFDGKRTSPLDNKSKPIIERSLPQTGHLNLDQNADQLTIPIRLRGQTIGFIDVKPKGKNRRWTQDDLTLLEAAAERAALALENARLVDSAQRRASREQTIGEITTKIGAVSDVETIMQAAVEELGRRIGAASEVTFELGSDD